MSKNEHAHGYGANLEVAYAERTAVGGHHAHYVAFLHIVGHGGESA